MKKITFYLFLSLSFQILGQDVTLDWAKKIGNPSYNEASHSVAVDNQGNVYTTGVFAAPVDFDPGIDTFLLASQQGYNIFVSKLDSDGNFVWAKKISATTISSGGGEGNSITVDDLGNVYITGYFFGSCDFDPGDGVFSLIGSDDFNLELFVSKFDTDGNFIWAKSFQGTHNLNNSLSIKVDESQNVYTTGYFKGTVDFDPELDSFLLSSFFTFSYPEIFISKLDINGDFIWAKKIGGSDWEKKANSLAVGNDGSVYTTGSFIGLTDFNPGIGEHLINTSDENSTDAFILKLDSNGEFVWVIPFAGIGNDEGYRITLDEHDNVYATGIFTSGVDFDPSINVYNLEPIYQDIYISKYDPEGNFIWTKQIGGDEYEFSKDIEIDNQGNILIAGYFGNSVDFDPGNDTFSLNAISGYDIFILNLFSNGDFNWVTSMENSYSGKIESIASNSEGKIYATGSFYGTIDLDPNETVFNLNASNYHDIFIMKLSDIKAGIVETKLKNTVSLYPNPCNGKFNIDLEKNISKVNISILDVQGRLIKKEQFSNQQIISLQLVNEPSGIYFVNIELENESNFLVKLIKN